MIARLMLFLSSYSPLFLLTAIRIDDRTVALYLYGAAAIGTSCFLAVLGAAAKVQPREWVFTTAEDRGGDVAGYLATYLFPFLTVADPSTRDLIAYAGFVAVVAVVYVRSSLVAVNPLAYCLGYRLFACTPQVGAEVLVLARRPPLQNSAVSMRRVLPRFYVAA